MNVELAFGTCTKIVGAQFILRRAYYVDSLYEEKNEYVRTAACALREAAPIRQILLL